MRPIFVMRGCDYIIFSELRIIGINLLVPNKHVFRILVNYVSIVLHITICPPVDALYHIIVKLSDLEILWSKS